MIGLRSPLPRWFGMVLIASVSFGVAGPIWGENRQSSTPALIKQGEVMFLPFPLGERHPAEVVARFQGREIPVFSTGGSIAVLLGIDMDAPPGSADVVVEERGAHSPPVVIEQVPITVLSATYGTQTLSLPDRQVDLDAPTLRRVEAEQEAVLATMQPVTPRLWEGAFIVPVEGPIQGTFGLRRVINGQTRRPHTGEDITASSGTPVLATNHGIVRMVADHFFSGKSVIVDHGLGMYSMYFHLSQATITVGDRVQKGQVIGAVGASGRVSGPHLHWGIRLNGARINPFSLSALALP